MAARQVLTAAQAPPVHVSPRLGALVALALAAWLLLRWARHRVLRGRLARTLSRSLATGRRPSARTARRMASRSISARRAARSFWFALLVSVLIAAVWLIAQSHGATG